MGFGCRIAPLHSAAGPRGCSLGPTASSLRKGFLSMTKIFSARPSRALTLAALVVLLALATQSVPAAAQDDDHDRDNHDRDNHKIVSTYVQNFHVFSGIFLRRMVDNGTAGKLDILVHAFIDIRADQAGNPHCAAFDEFADYQFFFDQTRSVDGSVDSFADGALRGQVHQLQELKKMFPNLKVLASIGGFSAGTLGFEAASATPASRKA